jgi:hypothetical protein
MKSVNCMQINTNFSLKLADDQVTPNNSYIGAHLKEDEVNHVHNLYNDACSYK